MGSPLPPDPYLALGVPKDASAGTIKTQYRKLVLKFHPDKVKDAAQKQAAVDQFHRIQTAWEIIGDEDKRQRYDAQCKLAELRRDAMERQGGNTRGSEVRTAANKAPSESPRGGSYFTRAPERAERVSPTYEERRPGGYTSNHGTDYFDAAPRPSSRKDAEYERSSKRPSARDERAKASSKSTKNAKEKDRASQKERERRAERDIRRERERKTSIVDETGSDSEENERQPRREEPELRRAREAYHEQAARDREAAQRGYYDSEERARKLYTQYDGAAEYIQQTKGSRQRSVSSRRPSPVRMSSSKDKVDYLKRNEGRPAAVRRGSSKLKTSTRSGGERRASVRESGRRSDPEHDHEETRRPAGLQQSKSSPADIKLPFDRERAQSVQVESPIKEEAPPKFKRADTMPHAFSSSRDRDSRRKDNPTPRGSGLRQTEINEGMPTPSPTPEYGPGLSPNKYRYHEEYADDFEYATPDGYKTEVRQPAGAKRFTRSPSPMRERERERSKPRAASSRHAAAEQRPAPPRTTSTTYTYTPGQGVESYSRPGVSRENSARPAPSRENSSRPLYGEIPTTRDTRSPRQTASRYSPPEAEGVRYQREIGPDDIKMQSGYSTSRRASAATKPGFSRSDSSRPIYAR